MLRTKEIEKYFPKRVFVEVIEGCNLRCKHCIRGHYDSLKFLSKNDFLWIVKELKSVGAKSIILTGGEPLLHPKINEIVNYALENFENVYINTNGILLSQNIVKSLSLTNPKVKLQISLDGLRETHNYIRGKGTFEKIVLNIKMLNKFGIKPIIGTVLNKRNYKELESMKSLLSGYKISLWRLMFFMPEGKGRENYNELYLRREEWKKIIKTIKKLDSPFKIDATEIFSFIGEDIPNLSEETAEAIGCEAGKFRIYIKINGDIIPCSMLSSEIAGNLFNDLLKEIWLESKILLKYRYFELNKVLECSECEYLKLCKGGCHGLSKLFKGDIYTKDPRCPLGKSKNEENLFCK